MQLFSVWLFVKNLLLAIAGASSESVSLHTQKDYEDFS